MHVVALKEASTCKSKGPKDVWFERTYDYVLACNCLKGKVTQMEVVEDFESRPHKAVPCVVKKRKEDTGMEQWRRGARKKH